MTDGSHKRSALVKWQQWWWKLQIVRKACKMRLQHLLCPCSDNFPVSTPNCLKCYTYIRPPVHRLVIAYQFWFPYSTNSGSTCAYMYELVLRSNNRRMQAVLPPVLVNVCEACAKGLQLDIFLYADYKASVRMCVSYPIPPKLLVYQNLATQCIPNIPIIEADHPA